MHNLNAEKFAGDRSPRPPGASTHVNWSPFKVMRPFNVTQSYGTITYLFISDSGRPTNRQGRRRRGFLVGSGPRTFENFSAEDAPHPRNMDISVSFFSRNVGIFFAFPTAPK